MLLDGPRPKFETAKRKASWVNSYFFSSFRQPSIPSETASNSGEFLFLWIVLPATRSVLRRPEGAGRARRSQTRGGGRTWRHRRHEAPPRVTGKPPATLRLCHPGAPGRLITDKKDPRQLSAGRSLFSQKGGGCGGWGFSCVWRSACVRQRRLAMAGSASSGRMRPFCKDTWPGVTLDCAWLRVIERL